MAFWDPAIDISGEMEKAKDEGAAFTLNGAPVDGAGIVEAMTLNDSGDRASLAMLQREIQDVIEQMRLRAAPGQYIPASEKGRAPTLNLKIPGNAHQNWTLEARWNRKKEPD